MQFGINSYSYAMTHRALDFLKHWHSCGFEHFELMAIPGHIWPSLISSDEIRGIRNFVSANNVSITTLNQPNIDINISGMTPEMRDYSVDAILSLIDLAAEIGCPRVIICPGKNNTMLSDVKLKLTSYFYEALDRLVPRCERNGVRILVENMPISFLPDAESLMSALQDYGCEDIDVCYDVANGAFIKQDVIKELITVGSRLKAIHLSDTGRERPEHAAYPHPQSVVPFESIVRFLNRNEIAIPPILEVISLRPDKEIRGMAMKLTELADRDN